MTGPVHRQYIACQFRPGDVRSYTYHNDREPVAVGDRVVISGRSGPQIVIVSEIVTVAPKFETKPIVGKERPMDARVGAEAA